MKTFNLFLFLLLLGFSAKGQQTVTITTGPKWTDVLLYKNNRPGYESRENTNYSSYAKLTSSSWTSAGHANFRRTMLKFDLGEIPANATIESATLYFYSDPSVTSSSAWNGNSQLSGSNAIYLEKVTQSWSANTVTWNNQPPSTTSGREWVGPSTSSTENITINIKDLVQGWVSNPSGNHGLKMFLDTEVHYRARNYASTNHANSGLHPKLVITYSTDDLEISNNFSSEINQVFQHVNRNACNTGLLLDYGLRFINIEAYNGIPSDSNYVDYPHWKNLYTTLYSMQFRQPATMASPTLVAADILNSATADNTVIPIVGSHYRYERYRDDAVSQNLVYISNNQIRDVVGRTQSPFEIRETFAITPKRDLLEGADHTFKFYSDHFYGNTGKIVSQVQADFGDGLGYRTVSFNQNINVTYSNDGLKTLRFKINYSDGTHYESRSQVKVNGVVSTCPNCRFTGDNAQELRITADSPYMGEAASATVTIETADAGNVLDQPLIVVEGFDAWQIISPDEPESNFSFLDFIRGSGVGEINIPIGGQTLNDALEAAGYDLIFVDFDDGTTYIQRNAYLLQTVIDSVNTLKAGSANPQPNVILGMSMGGLVARYALRDMELNSQNHDTRLYVSHDAPHRGANVPVGVQAMIRHLAVQGLSGGLPGLKFTLFTLPDSVPQLISAIALQESPAAKQMLTYQVSGFGNFLGYDNYEHINFINELQSMGYPQLTRNIAIANGSECGADQGFVAGSTMVSANATIDVPYWLNLLMPLALLTNYPQAGLFSGIYTTDTDIRFNLDVRALPNQAIERVYYSKLYTKKKILFTITVRTTLFEKSFNSNSSMLPLDNGSGGVYDVEELGVNLDDLPDLVQVINPRFSFVPTFSALDMGGGSAVIQNGDLFRVISPLDPPAVPKNIPFNNFFSNSVGITGNVNSLHTQFTLENGRWLMDELENGGGFYSCVSSCGYSPDISISGPSTVCSSSTFSIIGLPPGVGFVWNRSSNLSVNSGQGTANYSVSKTGNGNGWVEVRFIDDCGTTNAIRKNLWLGSPAAVGLSPTSTSITIGQAKTITVTSTNGSSGNISWSKTGTSAVFLSYTNSNAVVEGRFSGTTTIRATTSNACGSTSGVTTVSVTSGGGGGGGGGDDCLPSPCPPDPLSVYPNPSEDYFIISAGDKIKDSNMQATIRVVDIYGQPQLIINGHSLKDPLNISGLKNGIYTIFVETKDNRYTVRLKVE